MTRSGSIARRLAEELPRRYPLWGPIGRLDEVRGGFSGAKLFRVSTAVGSRAVKLSPLFEGLSETTAARHQVIEQIDAGEDPPLFPRLERDAAGTTIWTLAVESEIFVVEARDWLEDAKPQFTFALAESSPAPSGRDSSVRTSSAFALLARFHQAGNRVVLTDGERTHLQPSSPLPERYVREWQAASQTDFAAIEAATGRLPLDLREPTRAYLARLPEIAHRVGASLASLRGSSPPLRLCLRDAHRNNIAYVGDVARAFFDWDALRFDRRVGDFARLSASFDLNAGDAEDRIVTAVESRSPNAEASIEKWTAWESAALRPILATQVWLPPLNWLKWLLVEGQTFDDPTAAFARLRETLNLSILRSFSLDDA